MNYTPSKLDDVPCTCPSTIKSLVPRQTEPDRGRRQSSGAFSLRTDGRSIFGLWLLGLVAIGGTLELTAATSIAGDPPRNSRESATEVRPPAENFPADTIAYVELMPPEKLVQQLLDHPLRKELEALPQLKQVMKSKEFAAFLAGVGFLQFATGMEWQESLDVLAGRGWAVGVDPATQAVAAVFVSAQPEKLPKLYKGLVRLATQDNKGAVKTAKYRGLDAIAFNRKIFMVALDDRILVSNNKDHVKSLADRWLDGSEQTLASRKNFKEQVAIRGKSVAWGFVDLESIRKSEVGDQMFPEQTENIGVEVVVGGILDSLKRSDFATGEIVLSNDRLQLTFSTPFDSAEVSEARQYYFQSGAESPRAKQIDLPDTIGNIYSYRDIGRLWLTKEDLFGENHLSELSQADSTLSTLFGLDFGEQVLGATQPGLQIVARNQEFSNLETPAPDIKVPEFAVVLRLKEVNQIQRRLKIAYQSFVGFLNIQLAMQGNPQLELESERLDEIQLISATYLPNEESVDEGLIHYNFSPSVAFAGEWFIISSTRLLAHDLAQAASDGSIIESPEVNTSVEIKGRALSEILKANQEQLIVQNMLGEGNDPEEAEEQIGLLLNAVKLLQKVSLELGHQDKQLQFKFGIDLNLDASLATENR